MRNRVHDLFAEILAAQDAVAIAPHAGPGIFQQPRDDTHTLGVLPRVADKHLRLIGSRGVQIIATHHVSSRADHRQRRALPPHRQV